MYLMDGDATDVGGKYPGKEIDIKWVPGQESLCAGSVKKSTIEITELPINNETQAITISGWIKWKGASNVMAYGFEKYSLYSYRGDLGFHTGNKDLLGFNFEEFKNTYIYLTVVFRLGEPGEIYVNGEARQLEQLKGSFNSDKAKFDNKLNLFGWGTNASYRDFGSLDRMRLIGRGLSAEEVSILHISEKTFINSLRGEI